jgi:hypothetical protein
VQDLRQLARAQRDLEEVAATACAKCLHTIFGVELQKGIAEHPWGGVGASKAARSSMDAADAAVVFAHVRDEVAELLEAGEAGRSRLLRHKALLDQLYHAFPRPPAQVCERRAVGLVLHSPLACSGPSAICCGLKPAFHLHPVLLAATLHTVMMH